MEVFKCRWSISKDQIDGQVPKRVFGVKLWSTFTAAVCRGELFAVFQWRSADTIQCLQYHESKGQTENVSVLWGHVVLVVRDYNQSLHDLLPQESCIFEDIIQTLDQQIQPGLLKLTWISNGIVEWYVVNCQWLCAKSYKIVTNFQANKDIISINCKMISLLLVRM